jgi:hypothetical protein
MSRILWAEEFTRLVRRGRALQGEKSMWPKGLKMHAKSISGMDCGRGGVEGIWKLILEAKESLEGPFHRIVASSDFIVARS